MVNHRWAVESLEHAIQTGRNAHAFLITGPHSVGKTTLARALARRLLCQANDNPALSRNPPPCGECRACAKTQKGVHPDVMTLEGVPSREYYGKHGSSVPPRKSEREKRILLVDQIRELQKWLATAPFESKYKLAIVRRFEDANEEAANAFLKTLEEPPPYGVLILTAQDAGILLPTIVSRCQPLALRPLASETIERALVDRWHAEPAQAQLLARLSGGRLGWAVRALESPDVLTARTEALDSLNGLVQEGRAERITRAEGLAKDAASLPQVLETWQTWWRDVLLLASDPDARITNVDYIAALERQAERIPLADVHGALEATREAARQLGQNANARLVTEVLALRLPRS